MVGERELLREEKSYRLHARCATRPVSMGSDASPRPAERLHVSRCSNWLYTGFFSRPLR